ncbi:MAG: hypothetical protein IKR12_00910 [Clostridia bacterium]|nr:hypothetical protein [Clostridia bacterium]
MVANHVDKSLVVRQRAFDPQTISEDRISAEIRRQRESIPNRNKTYNKENDMSR